MVLKTPEPAAQADKAAVGLAAGKEAADAAVKVGFTWALEAQVMRAPGLLRTPGLLPLSGPSFFIFKFGVRCGGGLVDTAN